MTAESEPTLPRGDAVSSEASRKLEREGPVVEGKAHIFGVNIDDDNSVFYNPAQVFNRDLSIVVLRAFHQLINREENVKQDNRRKRQKLDPKGGPPVDSSPSPAPEVGGPEVVPSRSISVLEPLAASGLRSIRYCLELSDVVDRVVAGDLDFNAVRAIERNRALNELSSSNLAAVCADGNLLMSVCGFGGIAAAESFILPPPTDKSFSVPSPPAKKGPKAMAINQQLANHLGGDSVVVTLPRPFALRSPHRFDVVDVDPYGSVAGFLDAAVASVADGGLLCLTSTDMPVLCGNSPEVSLYKYGGTALKARYHHEMSLRLLLNAVSTAAAKHKRVIEPLLCCSIDFYVRCFVRVRDSAINCKLLASKSAIVAQCTSCDAFKVIPLGITELRESKARKGRKRKGDGVVADVNLLTDAQQQEPDNAGSPEVTKTPEANLHDLDATKFKAPQFPRGFESCCKQCGSQGCWIGGPFHSGPLYNREFLQICLSLLGGISEEEDAVPGSRNVLLESESTEAVAANKSSGVKAVNSSSTHPLVAHLRTLSKIRGLLTAVMEELVDIPLFYSIPSMFHNVKVQMIKLSLFRSALLNLGYQVSTFHREPQSIKTDAPTTVVFDILRKWAEANPPKNPECHSVLKKPIETENIQFEFHPGCKSTTEVPKWLPNPEPYWGPKSRAKSLR